MPITIIERFIVNQTPLIGSAVYDVEIERLVADCASGASFTLYATGVGSSVNIREHATVTADPILVFDENSLIRFFPNEPILALFTGGTPGDTAIITAQALTVLYRPRTIADEVSPGTIVSHGIAETGSAAAPDPGGWN
jgi:hypothetical protein